MAFTKQEQMFFNRVALRMSTSGEGLEQAAAGVIADDRRIVKKALAINDEYRGAFNKLSDSVYEKLN